MRLLPRSLVGRMAFLLGAALAVAQLANFGLILNEREKLALAQNDGPAITRFAGAFADVSAADDIFRKALVADLSHRGARFAPIAALPKATGAMRSRRDLPRICATLV